MSESVFQHLVVVCSCPIRHRWDRRWVSVGIHIRRSEEWAHIPLLKFSKNRQLSKLDFLERLCSRTLQPRRCLMHAANQLPS